MIRELYPIEGEQISEYGMPRETRPEDLDSESEDGMQLDSDLEQPSDDVSSESGRQIEVTDSGYEE